MRRGGQWNKTSGATNTNAHTTKPEREKLKEKIKWNEKEHEARQQSEMQ